jgi:glucokinase
MPHECQPLKRQSRPTRIERFAVTLVSDLKKAESIDAALVADIGATNARFALAEAGREFRRERVVACKDFGSLEEAIGAYLKEEPGRDDVPRLKAAALAVAGPVTDDQVTLTNHPWSFSITGLRSHFGLDRLRVINDFAAIAVAVPYLRADERRQVGGGAPVLSAPIAVLGPGSGLGISSLVPMRDGWRALSGEGGHATMSPASDRESAVLDRMRRRFDHISAERVLSGPGLVNLYNTLTEIDGVAGNSYTSSQITDPKLRERDPYCREVVDMFCAMLGTVAGNLALTIGALGGVYIAGGIVPKLGASFDASPFRKRFEDKGRLRSYLEPIPTYVVTHPFPAFLGLASLIFDWGIPQGAASHRPSHLQNEQKERKPDDVDNDLRKSP